MTTETAAPSFSDIDSEHSETLRINAEVSGAPPLSRPDRGGSRMYSPQHIEITWQRPAGGVWTLNHVTVRGRRRLANGKDAREQRTVIRWWESREDLLKYAPRWLVMFVRGRRPAGVVWLG